ncbi:MAG: glycine cleavage system aminomethyltransferase GcvT, partial [Rhodobacteraceae bacterium]|nr:glycine cleavage system aminomethyltransferase GcvT [Paracoccaceae bacterium]
GHGVVGVCDLPGGKPDRVGPVEAIRTGAGEGEHLCLPHPRRTGGARAGGFPGADAILAEFENGAARSRVGLRPVGRAPMRAGIVLFADQEGGTPVGEIQSGGFGPTVGGPIAMGRVDAARAQPGTTLYGEMRGKRLPVEVVPLPFTPAQYKR